MGELGSNQPTYNRPAVLAHGSWVQIPPPPPLCGLLLNCISLVNRLLGLSAVMPNSANVLGYFVFRRLALDFSR